MDESLKLLRQGGNLINAIQNLDDRHPAKIRYLTNIVESPKYGIKERWFAVMAFTKLQGLGSLGRLKNWIHHPQWFIRSASLKALGYVHKSRADRPIELVVDKLKDPSILVRDAALEVLGKWCPTEAVKPMLGMLDDPKHFRKKHPLYIRKRAVQTLGKCRTQSYFVKKRFVDIFNEKDMYGIHEATHKALKEMTGLGIPYSSNRKKMHQVWAAAFSLDQPLKEAAKSNVLQ